MFFCNCFQPQTHRWCVKKQLKKWTVNYTDIECFAFNPICEIYFFWEKYKKSVHLWLNYIFVFYIQCIFYKLLLIVSNVCRVIFHFNLIDLTPTSYEKQNTKQLAISFLCVFVCWNFTYDFFNLIFKQAINKIPFWYLVWGR